MNNKIVIAGGTGFLGRCLIKKFTNPFTDIVVLTRSIKPSQKNVSYVEWDGETLGEWTKELKGSTAVINLAGKSVNCRYTNKNKKEIISSRVNSTLIIGKAIRNCFKPPKVWINAGSAAIFGNSGDAVKDENSDTGYGFSSDVCKEWEKAFDQVNTPQTRKVFLRIGLVFGKDSWVLNPFLYMVKFGLGGTIGTGDQYITWIHEEDFLNLVDFIIGKEELNGIIHVASPYPVKNREFMKTLREVCSIPFGLPNPSVFVKIGTSVLGTEPELILSGRRAVSRILAEEKFNFIYPELGNGLREIIGK